MHLVQVLAVELDHGVAPRLEREALRAAPSRSGDELVDERLAGSAVRRIGSALHAVARG